MTYYGYRCLSYQAISVIATLATKNAVLRFIHDTHFFEFLKGAIVKRKGNFVVKKQSWIYFCLYISK